jgi:hypothetical protein
MNLLPDPMRWVVPYRCFCIRPCGGKNNYLKMQAAISDLRLRERAELGRAFDSAIRKLADDAEGFTYMSARLDSKPEWVYIFGSAKQIDRSEVLSRITRLAGGAMAFYEKSKCLVIVDRDGISYEVGLSRPGFSPSSADVEIGRRLFSALRVTSAPLEPVP